MSNEKQKTIIDIAAEMRHGLDKSWHEIDREWMHDLPGRIEAAAKRQEKTYLDQIRDAMNMWGHEKHIAEHAQKLTVGNAAAMREVLEECANMGEQIDCQLGSSDETVYAFRHERCLAHNISECARAALSEPPRNCDRFNSGDPTRDAVDAYNEWQRHCDCSLMPPSCKVESAFRQWLLSPAKPETKGECDGSK